MTTERTTGGVEQPRDPDCFEEWLCDRLRERCDRQDDVGRVARWVLRENREGRWAPGPVLLARHGHAYDVPAHYGRVLRHCEGWPENFIEAFFRVYDLYLKDDGADYDQMVEERGRKLDEEFEDGRSGGSCGDGGDTPTGPDEPESGADKPYSWESWNRFFYDLHGSEQLGYELDEDDHPVNNEPDGDVEAG